MSRLFSFPKHEQRQRKLVFGGLSFDQDAFPPELSSLALHQRALEAAPKIARIYLSGPGAANRQPGTD
jgi:hypothetical protein